MGGVGVVWCGWGEVGEACAISETNYTCRHLHITIHSNPPTLKITSYPQDISAVPHFRVTILNTGNLTRNCGWKESAEPDHRHGPRSVVQHLHRAGWRPVHPFHIQHSDIHTLDQRWIGGEINHLHWHLSAPNQQYQCIQCRVHQIGVDTEAVIQVNDLKIEGVVPNGM